MHFRERITYYVFLATKDEVERNVAGRIGPFNTIEEAKGKAKQELQKTEGETHFVKAEVEQRHEFWDGYHREWCIDWDWNYGRRIVWSATNL